MLPSGGLGEPGSGLSGSRWVCSSLIKVGAAAGSVGRGRGCEGGVGGSLGAGRVSEIAISSIRNRLFVRERRAVLKGKW